MAVLLLCLHLPVCAQDDVTDAGLLNLPLRFTASIQQKLAGVSKKLSRQTNRLLKQYARQEERLLKKLAEKDPAIINGFPDSGRKELGQLAAAFATAADTALVTAKRNYNPYTDTLRAALQFIGQGAGRLLNRHPELEAGLQKAIQQVNGLDGKFDAAEAIRKLLRGRKAWLRQNLERYGMSGQLKKIEKLTYYYNQYLQEYRQILSDKKQLERKAMSLLYQLPFFKKFVSEHSALAGLFQLPGTAGSATVTPTLPGIQTRASVTAIMQTTIARGGADAMALVRQQVQAGQAELGALRNRIMQSGNADGEIPGFKPNNQKTKSFKKRLVYGCNFQFGNASRYFPGTADIAVTAGYKLTDKALIGVAVAYKLGLGEGWKHIRLSNEGLGLRSYIDWKIKGAFYLAGGYEQNYYSRFAGMAELRNWHSWQASGIIGISRQLKLNGKKTAKIQVLYDMLYSRHRPATQPFIFRTGINFK